MSEHGGLREYRQEPVDRINDAGHGGRPQSLLAVESADQRWLIELSDIAEVLPLQQITTVPLTLPWYAGLVNVRGALHSVVDLSAFQGGAPTARDENSRLLLVASRHGINSALLVSRVLGLKSSDSLDMSERVPELRPWVGDQFRDAKGVAWTRLLLPLLLKSREFLEVGR